MLNEGDAITCAFVAVFIFVMLIYMSTKSDDDPGDMTQDFSGKTLIEFPDGSTLWVDPKDDRVLDAIEEVLAEDADDGPKDVSQYNFGKVAFEIRTAGTPTPRLLDV